MTNLDNYFLKNPPIFIIGAARSGTKYLRETLAQSPSLVPTPYDIPFIWRYGNQTCEDDCIPPSLATKKAKAFIQRKLLKIAGGKKKCFSKTIVEKTVGNTLRVSFVHEIFPDSRFVHLIRDGKQVVESALRQWHAPADVWYLLKKARHLPIQNIGYAKWFLKNTFSRKKTTGKQRIWGPRYPNINKDIEVYPLPKVCARQWRLSVEKAEEQLKTIPSSQQFEVRYENLNQEYFLNELLEFVGIKDKEAIFDFVQDTFKKKNSCNLRAQLTEYEKSIVANEINKLLSTLGYESL